MQARLNSITSIREVMNETTSIKSCQFCRKNYFPFLFGVEGAFHLRPKQRSLKAGRLEGENRLKAKFVKGLGLNMQEHPNLFRSANTPLKKLSVRHRRIDGFDLAASPAKSKDHRFILLCPSGL